MDFLTPAYRASFCTTKSHDGSSFTSFQKEFTPVMSAVDSVTFIADQMKDDKDGQQVEIPLFGLQPLNQGLVLCKSLAKHHQKANELDHEISLR